MSFYCDPSFPLDIEFVEDLLVSAGLDCAGQLEQPVAERAFAMVDMSDDAKVAVALNGNCGDARFEVGEWRCVRCMSKRSRREMSQVRFNPRRQ